MALSPNDIRNRLAGQPGVNENVIQEFLQAYYLNPNIWTPELLSIALSTPGFIGYMLQNNGQLPPRTWTGFGGRPPFPPPGPGTGSGGISGPFQPETLDPLGTRWVDQPPQMAFERYLANLESSTGGQRFSNPVRAGLYTRGNALGTFAPLFGFAGAEGEPNSFSNYYQQQSGRLPSQAEFSSRLGALAEAQRLPEEMRTAQQSELAGYFPTEQSKYNLLLQNYLARLNPAIRQGVQGSFQDVFERQQATSPETPFLAFAKQRGYY